MTVYIQLKIIYSASILCHTPKPTLQSSFNLISLFEVDTDHLKKIHVNLFNV